MKKIGHTREREGLIPAYVATDNLSFMDSQCSKTEQGAAIGFVDDLFFNIEVDNEMVLAEGGECVVERVCRALQIIAWIVRDHGLQFHDKTGNTMVMLQFTVQTKGAKQIQGA